MLTKEKLLSLTEVQEALGISPAKAVAWHQAGILIPDFTSRNSVLFHASRLPELRRICAETGLLKAVAANAARQKVRPVTGSNIH